METTATNVEITEYTVELQDTNGTAYGTVYPFTNDTIYFENFKEAKLYAKGLINDKYVLVRIIENSSGSVVDFFQK